MRRVFTVVGARPQFIKAAPVSHALAKSAKLQEILVHTGQHFDREMSEMFFSELSIPPPRHHLGINSGSHGEMTGRMLTALESVMVEERPDCVLVYGDTNSTLAGALAAAKLHIPIAHVEAGLRSFNKRMPEEINRVLTDHVSAFLFCPTQTAIANLAREGIAANVHNVGDVMYDATLLASAAAKQRSTILRDLGLVPGDYDLATVHRAETTDDREALAAILCFLDDRARVRPVVMPLHPRTRLSVSRFGLSAGRVRVIPPVGYLDMVQLLGACAEVITDSGGLQKEAYFHRKPCITLRDETEWVETIDAGWNRLWRDPVHRRRREIEEYGDGRAAHRVVAILERAFG